MKHRLLPLLFIATTAQAQVVHFPMEVSNNKVTEQISGNITTVSGVRNAVSTQGAIGNALRTDGYSTFVEADIDNAKLNGDAMTFAMWIAAETYPMMNIDEDKNDYTTIAGTLDHTAKTGFAFQVTNRGNWRFECYAGSGSEFNLEATDVLPKRQWCHLAATVDAENKLLTLYLNGEQVAQETMRKGLNLGSGKMLIGKSHEDIEHEGFLLNTFNGIIDDITIYDKVLSANDIKTMANEADVACGSAANVATPASAFADDLFRPRLHGMPSAGWTNESHGMTYSDGCWHVFFQKNGNGPYMSRLHWGHITSKDLCNWEEQPIAIDPAEAYDIKGCWSGCVVNDEKIFGNHPGIIYTGVDYVKASINFANPTDATLLSWQKTSGNPRIAKKPAGLSDDFRDPYFFRTENGAYIIVGSSKDGVGCCTLHKYDESKGTWSNDGTLFFQGSTAFNCGTFWEMPNVTPMDDNRWLFTVTPQATGEGVRTLYWVGTINADGTFAPIDGTWPQTVELSGMSKDGYGLLSPTIAQNNGKTIALGIVPDKVATRYNKEWGWAHCYSLPREWSLDEKGLLIQRPYNGLQSLRSSEKKYAKKDFTLNGTEKIENVSGRQIEVAATFQVGSSDFGVNILDDGQGHKCSISYSPESGKLTVDASTLDRVVNDSRSFNGVYSSRIPAEYRPATGEDLNLQIFLDGSVLDIFFGNRYASSIRIFATSADATEVSAFADGNTMVRNIEAWNLEPDNSDTAIEEIIETFPGKEKSFWYEIAKDTHQLQLFYKNPNGVKVRGL